ncbi:MAG: polysaccharide lyase 8 family protein [Bacteroidota bacterium]|nr:polysaccharide lyase 8 family protein [Bacteroidota bacterium]
MKFLSRYLVLSFLCFSILSNGYSQIKSSYSDDLAQLHQNVINDILSDFSNENNIEKISKELNDKGFWPDINYLSKQRGAWQPNDHFTNALQMAKAYQTSNSKYFHDPKLSAKILLALDYWFQNDFQCPNWWYPQIGVPMTLAPIMILMEDELSVEQKEKGIKILDRAKIGMTGQNKVWLSGNVLLKSLLLRDVETIRKASASIQEEMKVSMQEGIQADGSFHQHGPQIQFGNYGLAYVESMIKWISVLRNTPFQFEETKMAILRNYLLEGQQWVTWKNRMDISACGRQLFVNSPAQKARSLAYSYKKMQTLDPAFAGEYNKAMQYQNLVGDKHFWRSDFQVKRSPDYYFSVKMCSKRVIGAESCNSENIQGYYLGDGATYFYQKGQEYENIFPYWDWKKIPGTTTQQDNRKLPVLTASGYRIASDFVGGVSDGKIGVAAMDYNRDGLMAKKSWFLFNGQIICLGAGISSAQGFPVTTSVNQTLLDGKVIIKTKSEQVMGNTSVDLSNPRWILHNQTGYFFPNGGNLKLEPQVVKGSWNRVASRYKDVPIKTGVFKLWFDHGVNPSSQTYAYVLVPDATISIMKKLETANPFRIIKNDENMQSVVSTDGSLAGIVYYKAGKADVFGGVAVDQPCIIMLQKESGQIKISVSDPTQKLVQVQVSLKGKFLSKDASTNLAFESGKSIVTVSFPKGDEAGKTISMNLYQN